MNSNNNNNKYGWLADCRFSGKCSNMAEGLHRIDICVLADYKMIAWDIWFKIMYDVHCILIYLYVSQYLFSFDSTPNHNNNNNKSNKHRTKSMIHFILRSAHCNNYNLYINLKAFSIWVPTHVPSRSLGI